MPYDGVENGQVGIPIFEDLAQLWTGGSGCGMEVIEDLCNRVVFKIRKQVGME